MCQSVNVIRATPLMAIRVMFKEYANANQDTTANSATKHMWACLRILFSLKDLAACKCGYDNHGMPKMCDELGYCECEGTKYGLQCQFDCKCVNPKNGIVRCDKLGYCVCQDGYWGKDCAQECDCGGYHNGTCDAFGYCVCSQGLYGPRCDTGRPLCGQTFFNYQSFNRTKVARMIGGSNEFYNVPWVAQIINKAAWDDGLNEFIMCSGVIIDERHVLTYRSCVNTIDNGDYAVLVGDYLSNFWDVSESLHKIRLYHYTEYSMGDEDSEGDYEEEGLPPMALITVEDPGFTYSAFVQPICLPPSTYIPRGRFQMASWGKTNHLMRPSVVRSARYNYVNNDLCLRSVDYEPKDLICATGREFAFAINHPQGKGSPLTYYNKTANAYHLAGLWFRSDSPRNNYKPDISYFRNVVPSLNWILENLQR